MRLVAWLVVGWMAFNCSSCLGCCYTCWCWTTRLEVLHQQPLSVIMLWALVLGFSGAWGGGSVKVTYNGCSMGVSMSTAGLSYSHCTLPLGCVTSMCLNSKRMYIMTLAWVRNVAGLPWF